jgi:hypothetical protein
MPKQRHHKTPTMLLLEATDPEKRPIEQIMLDSFRDTGTELAAATSMGVTQQTYNVWKYRPDLDEAIFRLARDRRRGDSHVSDESPIEQGG